MRKFLILIRISDRFCADVRIRPDEGRHAVVNNNVPG